MPCGGTYLENTQLTLTAVPDTGYEFVEWTGDLAGTTENPVELIMDRDVSIGANFKEALLYDFSTDSTEVLAGQTVQFMSVSGAAVTKWLWDFGDGFTSDVSLPEHSYTNPGTYTVSLTVSDDAESSTRVKEDYISVYQNLEADFVVDQTEVLTAQPVQFTDMSSGSPTSWEWNFGDGETSTDPCPAHAYSRAGAYRVTLTVSNRVVSDTETRDTYIKVYPPLEAWFLFEETRMTKEEPMDFSSVASGGIPPIAYEWDFDGNGTVDSIDQNPSHPYASAGTYTVSLRLTDASGASSLATRTVTVSEPRHGLATWVWVAIAGGVVLGALVPAYFIRKRTSGV